MLEIKVPAIDFDSDRMNKIGEGKYKFNLSSSG